MLIDVIVQGSTCTSSFGEALAYGAQEGSPVSVLQLNGSATNRTESFDLDADTASDALADGSDSPALTQRLLVDLVLMFMKHVLHWAGSDRVMVHCAKWQSNVLEHVDTDERETGPARLDKGAPVAEHGGWFFARVKALCDRAASVVLDGETCIPPSWRCLINLAKLILKYSTSLLETTLERQVHESEEGKGVEEMKPALDDRLQETLVGLLLPTVVTALLPFAHVPVFARSLAKLVNTTVGLLDDACTRCSRTRQADEKCVAARSGEGESSKSTRKPQVKDCFGARRVCDEQRRLRDIQHEYMTKHVD